MTDIEDTIELFESKEFGGEQSHSIMDAVQDEQLYMVCETLDETGMLFCQP